MPAGLDGIEPPDAPACTASRFTRGTPAHQMLMGGGKTTVIGPMLALLLGRPQRALEAGCLVVQVVPDALLDMSRNVMRAAFGTLLPKAVYSFSFARENQGDRVKQLKGELAEDLGLVGRRGRVRESGGGVWG